MQSIVHKTVESMTHALGPIFHQVQDWETIRLATVMVMARVIQATPHKGKELEIFDATANDILHALEQILRIEEEELNAKAAQRDRALSGIEGFAGFAVNGHAAGEPVVLDPPVDWQFDDTLPDEEDLEEEEAEQAAEGEAFRESLDAVERDLEAREAKEREDQDSPDGPREYL